MPAESADRLFRRPRVMGIVNVTPDSFSDGGLYLDPQTAIAHGLAMVADGADILDIGGESTRPGAKPVAVEDEIARVIPVMKGLAGCGVPLSIDTRHARVMAAALDEGATMVNDITALAGDPDSMTLMAGRNATICLMHMQGTPETMQHDPSYNDVIADVMGFLAGRIAQCVDSGIARDRLMIDPGIGFGKSPIHNLSLLRHLAQFRDLGVPVLVGLSRKRFIDAVCPGTESGDRLPGSLAGALWCAAQGADVIRVHDVAETVQALAVMAAIHNAP